MPDPQSDAEPPSTDALISAENPGAAQTLSESKARLHVLFEEGEEAVPNGVTPEFMQQCCQAALDGQCSLSLDEAAVIEVSVQLLDTQAMRALNQQYRQKDSPTNVLSFASGLPLMSSESEGESEYGESFAGGLLVLGDLVLCPAVVDREAQEQGKPLLHHWAHMLVHGSLHLCGHDHEEDQEARLMEAAEIRILSGLGIPNPYVVENAVNGQ